MNIVIGVTAGIACYKNCELVRLLRKADHQVKIVMTEHAKQFVHPNTFAALSGNPVYSEMFSADDDAMPHITLAKWADIIVIAPATAETISKIAQGGANNLLMTICLATSATVYIAPAMNKIMWEHSIVQQNINSLNQHGYKILQPAAGEQACGDIGDGRMMEPTDIFNNICGLSELLAGVKVVITAGPTYEKLDPVRYISNFSSGKMGYALANALAQHGASVTLISGPTELSKPANCAIVNVQTADKMLKAAKHACENTDVFISCAAVADYKPEYSTTKIKKSGDKKLTIELTKNIDMLATIAKANSNLFCIGFCAETDDLISNAKQKLANKNLQAIIANQISEQGYPFAADSNQLTYINNHGKVVELAKAAKTELAQQLVKLIYADYSQRSGLTNINNNKQITEVTGKIASEI